MKHVPVTTNYSLVCLRECKPNKKKTFRLPALWVLFDKLKILKITHMLEFVRSCQPGNHLEKQEGSAQTRPTAGQYGSWHQNTQPHEDAIWSFSIAMLNHRKVSELQKKDELPSKWTCSPWGCSVRSRDVKSLTILDRLEVKNLEDLSQHCSYIRRSIEQNTSTFRESSMRWGKNRSTHLEC